MQDSRGRGTASSDEMRRAHIASRAAPETTLSSGSPIPASQVELAISMQSEHNVQRCIASRRRAGLSVLLAYRIDRAYNSTFTFNRPCVGLLSTTSAWTSYTPSRLYVSVFALLSSPLFTLLCPHGSSPHSSRASPTRSSHWILLQRLLTFCHTSLSTTASEPPARIYSESYISLSSPRTSCFSRLLYLPSQSIQCLSYSSRVFLDTSVSYPQAVTL